MNGDKAVYATSSPVNYSNGIQRTASGAIYCVDATAGLPAGTTWTNGLPFSVLGALCIANNTVVTWSNGIPFDANGAVCAAFLPDIASLFANGEEGWWYDPSDFATLFQDSAGTTPVTAVEQPVGLQLDLSKGLVASTKGAFFPRTNTSNLSTPAAATSLAFSGDFTLETQINLANHPAATAAEFIAKGAGATYDYRFYMTGGGSLVLAAFDSGGTQRAYVASSSISIIGGPTTWLKVTLDVDNGAGSSVAKFYQSTDGVTYTQIGTDRTLAVTYTIRDTASSFVYLGMDNPSFSQAMLGKMYRAIFKSGVDGPTVADFNPTLYTGGATFSAATGQVWTINGSANITPDGNHRFQTTSANRPVVSARVNLLTKTDDVSVTWAKAGTATTPAPNTLNLPAFNDYIYQINVAPAGVALTLSALLSGSGTVSLVAFDNASGGFQLQSVTLTATPTRYSFNFTFGSGASDRRAGVGRFAGNTATTVTVTDLDLRPTNQGVNLPAYQRVNTSTDYDSTGFPVYIKPNGSNQFMQTNSINFTATDKMTVWQGVRKLSDAATGMIAELSTGAIAGSFAAYTAGSGVAGYGCYSMGSVGPAFVGPAITYTAPITNTLTVLGDISGDLATLRVNGVQVAQNTGDQGTGNYGNYPAYFYARGGSSFFFNGHDYGSIARGAASTAAQIAAGEEWINSKTKAY
jgi:hypothetical protein